jgi:hypothetical protein
MPTAAAVAAAAVTAKITAMDAVNPVSHGDTQSNIIGEIVKLNPTSTGNTETQSNINREILKQSNIIGEILKLNPS